MQKSHTKVLLLFFFRSLDGAADRRSFAEDMDRSIADVRCNIRGVQFALGSWKLFELSRRAPAQFVR